VSGTAPYQHMVPGLDVAQAAWSQSTHSVWKATTSVQYSVPRQQSRWLPMFVHIHPGEHSSDSEVTATMSAHRTKIPPALSGLWVKTKTYRSSPQSSHIWKNRLDDVAGRPMSLSWVPRWCGGEDKCSSRGRVLLVLLLAWLAPNQSS
jgi:hypothetical protein